MSKKPDDATAARRWAAEVMPRCHDCGRFSRMGPGSAWKMVYSGFPHEPDREIMRCAPCVTKIGPFEPQIGITPESSCGMVAESAAKNV